MKVRIKFSKHGEMKFIGHLDMMRYFQKAMRRADIDIAFTEGFSPHMIMSFALPLGVGVTSDAEYMDIELRTPISSAEAVCRLNRVMADGVKVLSFRQIDGGKASKAMSLVAAADYTVRFRKEKELARESLERLPEFLLQDQIIVVRKTKTSEREEDIRPLIYLIESREDCLFMRLAAGSAANLKPELVMEAFAQFCGCSLSEHALLVNREELYASQDTPEGGQALIALNDLGRNIES